MIVTIAGGVGAARMLSALRLATDEEIIAVVNVGDDDEIYGLSISPDLDTICYTLAGAIDPERGWGLRDETWDALESLRRYATHADRPDIGWFQLGDRDLGTHLYRTTRLADGATLSEVTAEITSAWGLDVTLVPATDDRLRTRLLASDGETLEFQQYFVRDQHDRTITDVLFDGAGTCEPAPGVLAALGDARVVVIAPSNPLVSIDPVLAVSEIRDALTARVDDVVAVSPIVGGAALKGPAARLMSDMGLEPSAVGIARHFEGLISALVIDPVDADLAPAIDALGIRPVVVPSVMSTPEVARSLAEATLGAVAG